MSQATLAWAAFKNMMRQAARDPFWALVQIIFAPIRGGIYVMQIILGVGIIVLILGFCLRYLLGYAGYPPGTVVSLLGDILVGVIALVLLFRAFTNPMILHFGDMGADTHGSARFATDKEVAPLARTADGLLIGRDGKTGKPLRYDGPAHLLTMAPTRTGKGVGTIIPNLLTANRSVICIDPKGENARIAGRAREKFGPVHVLDPFGITGKPSAAFNPLDTLDPDGLDVAEDATTLADALVYDDPGTTAEPHWNHEAKALIAGVILHIVTTEPRDRRTLATLRDNITLAPDAFAALLKAMQASTAAQRHTHFLDSPRMTAVLGRSDFRFADLKSRNATVFFVLPLDRFGTYFRWLRLLVTESLTAMSRTPELPPAPVLYLLDECAALGRLEPVERAMGAMAGYGVQLWPIFQDLHQLRDTYRARAGTFLSNSAVLQVFAVNDHESARLVSDMLGQETAVFKTMGQALDSDKSGISYGEHHSGRPLLTPDEVRTLPQHAQILFLAGQRPILAGKLQYYTDREFRGLFDQIER